MNNIKILLAIPTYRTITSEAFAYHMAMLLDGLNSGLVKRLEIEANMYVTLARNTMCETALAFWRKGEITHLLMVDDDMVIPSGTITKLATHNAPVVGAVYYSRGLQPIAYDLDPFKWYTTIPKSGIVEVEGTGCGCLLISCELLAQMSDFFKDRWWFQNDITPNLLETPGSYLGEDVFFFMRLKKMGVKAILDCDIQCGHFGSAIVDRDVFELHNGMKQFVPTVSKISA